MASVGIVGGLGDGRSRDATREPGSSGRRASRAQEFATIHVGHVAPYLPKRI